MARFTGESEVAAVLQAADAWRDRCFLKDDSVLSDEPLWSRTNLDAFQKIIVENPIEGSRDFFDKLKEQLAHAQKAVVKLAAEVVWFYLLFPHKSGYSAQTKANQVREVWSWSGDPIPDERFLAPEHLVGVGGVGIAYLTRRPDQLWFLLDVMCEWKTLSDGRRTDLMHNNKPWDFVAWINSIPHADKRPIRNAFLYFVFPDELERIVSNDHREQIYSAFKSKIPVDLVPKSASPSLLEMDRAIASIRKVLEAEHDTDDLDFYRSPLQGQWSSISAQRARRNIASTIERALEPYGLELRQCGSKKANLAACKEVDNNTGFWKDAAEATNKPLRWIIHLDMTTGELLASLAEKDGKPLHGNRRIAFSNNAQGKSGAVTVRIVPAIKVGEGKFVFYEEWEWLLLLCFYPALSKGSSGQLLEDFDPASGDLVYMGQKQPYVFSSLIALNVEDAELSVEVGGAMKRLTYQEATQALAHLINVNTAADLAEEVQNAA